MDQATKQKLVKIIEYIKSGNKQAAIPLLAEVLKTEPELEQGWYLLGMAIDDENKKRYAFSQVLKLNPGHAKAQEQLDKLDAVKKSDFVVPDWMEQRPFQAEAPPLPDYAATPPPTPEVSDKSSWAAQPQQESEPDLPDWARRVRSDTPKIEHIPMASYSARVPEETEEPVFEDEVEEGEIEADSAEEALRKQLQEPVKEEPGKKKKKQKREKRERTKEEKRRTRRTVFILFILLVCSGAGVFGYLNQELVKEIATPYMPMVMTQAAPITGLLPQFQPTSTPLPSVTDTPILRPTLPPTWTPSPTKIPTLTPFPTKTVAVTPSATLESLPLPPDTVAEMETIQQQVIELRQLNPAGYVSNDIMPKLKLRMVMEDWMIDEAYLEELSLDEIAYRALGLVNSNYNLVDAALNTRGDAIGGFYMPEYDEVFVIGTGFYGVEKYIYAHEYAHALQDANFDLNNIGIYPRCQKAAQTCQAIQSLVEGDATLTQLMWLETYPPVLEQNDILRFQPPSTLFQADAAPPFFALDALFPYTYGYEFVNYLYQNGGWGAVNKAYRLLPDTTEQVIHPEKYLSREGAQQVSDPDLAGIFPEGWEQIKSDSLGEWKTYLLLAAPDYTAAKRLDTEAATAAAGWGGDHYQVYYNSENQQTLMAVHWLWESNSDANEFYNSFNASLNGRFQNAAIDGPGTGLCWLYDGQYSCLYKQDRHILWLYSQDLGLLETAHAEFTYFP